MTTALPPAFYDAGAQSPITVLAASQIENYLRQPAELVGHFNREVSALDGYRGRQVLELLQNADDAGVDSTAGCALLFSLSRERLIVANTGTPFSPKGLTSLVISDCSPKQLDRNRFIGCKGLGFRSVLTWSDSPLIASGLYEVCFDRSRAARIVEQLATQSQAVADEVTPFRNATGRVPAATMRFPGVPEPTDPRLVEARAFRERGFDTVIVLPIPDGARGDGIHADMLEQLADLPTSSLLFCRHLARVEVVGDLARGWELLREQRDPDSSTVLLEQEGKALELWKVYRRSGRVSEDAAQSSSAGWREFEVAVAVPDAVMANPGGNLCVFFPTHDRLPCALVMHATLETTDDRNRLVAHKSNMEVLGHLASHVASVLEQQAGLLENQRQALELLSGLEDADPELKALGFSDAVVRECAKRKIFPRLDGSLEASDAVRQVPDEVWLSELDRQLFPEVLAIGPNDALSGLLSLFQLTWFPAETLKDRLQQYLLRVDRGRAGQILGRVLAAGQLGTLSADGLLIGTTGDLITDGTCFFTPVEKLPPLPSWATSIRFVDEVFQAGLLRGADVAGLRFLASDLSRSGCDVDEYRFDTVARTLIDAIEVGVGSDAAKLQRWRQLLRWLYDASAAAHHALPQLMIQVPTLGGGLKRATACYLGPVYPRGQLVSRLYQQFGVDEFVVPPSECGLDGVSVADAEDFLVATGVNAVPRMEPLRPGETYKRFIRATVERLDYPRSVRGRRCESAADVRALLTDYAVEGLRLPDRWLKLLKEGDGGAVVAYLLSSGGSLMVGEIDPQAQFSATIGAERLKRTDPSVPIPNATLFFLRETSWIPAADGKRRRPAEIMLSSQGVRVLRGVYAKHALDPSDELIAACGGREAMEALLSRLGAVTSLETLSGQSLYELLLALPDRDPNGEVARSIYRTLIKSSVSAEDSPHRNRFLRTGRMWGRRGGAEGYLPISELRYNANLTITKAVAAHLSLVDIPMRMSAALIKELFGVVSLTSQEIQLKLLSDGTEYDPGSEDANQHLRVATPYIYALRLADNLDERGRELNLLTKAAIRVCSRARVIANLPGGQAEEIILDRPGDGIVVDTTLVVIGQYQDDGSGFLRFWLHVAELVAQLLGRDEAAEIGGVLRCRTPPEMLEVVRIRLSDDADSKLSEARSRLEDVLAGKDHEQPIPPPRPPTPPAPAPIASPATDVRAQPGVERGGPPEMPGPAPTFLPVPGPSPKPPKRRKLVVTGSGGGSGGGGGVGRGLLATEPLTFKVVEAFERAEGRFVIRVSHLRGADSFGCDLLSVVSRAVRDKAMAEQSIMESEIARYIEVKGRSSRTGQIELTDNEYRAAKRLGGRYWLYRVFVDPVRDARYEVAVLSDPLNSNAVRTVTRFDLADGSGATWYSMVETAEDGDVGGQADSQEEPDQVG